MYKKSEVRSWGLLEGRKEEKGRGEGGEKGRERSEHCVRRRLRSTPPTSLSLSHVSPPLPSLCFRLFSPLSL